MTLFKIGEEYYEHRDIVNTASINVSTAGPLNVSTADPSTRPRTTSVLIMNVEKNQREQQRTNIQKQDKGKQDGGSLNLLKEPSKIGSKDAEIAQRLFEEEQAQFEREQRIAREKATEQEAKDAVLIEQMEDIQARIDADELLAERLQQEEREQFTIKEKSRLLVEMIAFVERKQFFAHREFTHNQLKNRSLEEIQMLYKKEQKWIDDFVPMDSELEVQRLKRVGEEQSTEKEKELSEEELQKLLVVVPVEEVYVEALQVKYPIIDWEVYSEDTRRYWKIIRVRNHTEAYQIFTEMLKKFDRDDLVKLWDLVKEMFSTTEPTDNKEKELVSLLGIRGFYNLMLLVQVCAAAED
ncbi:hypothetical protein Tco_0233212 [Tanacetum coccineum]